MIVSCVTFEGFRNKFSKCCFHRCIRSSWLLAFSLAFAVLLLLHTSFTVGHAILDCLSSTEFLILLMYSLCSFRYMLINSFCAFLSYWVLIFVRFLLFRMEEIFTSARFFLNANVSHETLGLALYLVGTIYQPLRSGRIWHNFNF